MTMTSANNPRDRRDLEILVLACRQDLQQLEASQIVESTPPHTDAERALEFGFRRWAENQRIIRELRGVSLGVSTHCYDQFEGFVDDYSSKNTIALWQPDAVVLLIGDEAATTDGLPKVMSQVADRLPPHAALLFVMATDQEMPALDWHATEHQRFRVPRDTGTIVKANFGDSQREFAWSLARVFAMRLPGPEVAVGGLIIARDPERRFFVARRRSGNGQGTWGTLGGLVRRNERLEEAFMRNAIRRTQRAELPLQVGPLLSSSNMLGNGEHSLDLTFLVLSDEAFDVDTPNDFISEPSWVEFDRMVELYNGVGPDRLFAPVANAFRGYCIQMLFGALGQTFHTDIAHAVLSRQDARSDRMLLAQAASIHAHIDEPHPFFYETTL